MEVEKLRTAILFPPLMKLKKGDFKNLYDCFPIVREQFEQASDIIGIDLAKSFFLENEAMTNRGDIARTSIVTISSALYKLIRNEISQPDFYLGPSLGQVNAIHCSESLDFTDTVKMIQAMCLMEAEEKSNKGNGVYFFYNIDTEVLDYHIAELRNKGCTLEPCMYGTSNQMIVNGDTKSLEELSSKISPLGGLGITIPYGPPGHCSLLQSVKERFENEFMPMIKPVNPIKPLVSNVTATPLYTGKEIANELVNQYTKPVQWYQSLKFLAENNVQKLIVVGPGNFVAKSLQFTDIDFEVESYLVAEEINKICTRSSSSIGG